MRKGLKQKPVADGDWFLCSVVGPPGFEPGKSPAPHAGVLPLHYSPVEIYFFIESFNAVGADLDSLSVNARPLEVHVAFGFYGWIIMAAKQNSRCGHCWFFPALRAFGCHMIVLHNTLKLLSFQGMPGSETSDCLAAI